MMRFTILRREHSMTYGTLPGDYPASSKWLHWLVAICVLTTAVVAVTMVNLLPEGPTQDKLFVFHKSLGVLILILMTLRLINRLVVGAPAPDPAIEPWQRKASSAVHGSLYVLLFAMAIVGLIGHSLFGAATPFFGLFEIPPFTPKNEGLSDALFVLHKWVGFLVIALVVLHISAALYHALIRHDGVIYRMLPRAFGGGV
jgi:cytochrome b561